MSKEDENQFNRFYQDLIWVLVTPPLLNSNYYHKVFETANSPSNLMERLRFYFLPILKTKQLNQEDVVKFLRNQVSNRLGHYYESLLEFLFLYHPDIQLIKKNCVLQRKDGTTLGEFDFILYDSIYKLQIHLEVAVKFYLQFKLDCLPSSFIGANFNDRLDQKISKLHHQIGLSSSDEGKNVLIDLKNSPLQKIILMQGILFYPWDKKIEIPDFLNLNHLKGNYLLLSNLQKSNTFLGKYLILPKLKWLSAPNGYEWKLGMNYNNFEEYIQNHFSYSSQSLYVVRKDLKGSIRVFFVLPDSIPHLQ